MTGPTRLQPMGQPTAMADAASFPDHDVVPRPDRSQALVYRFGLHCFDTVTGTLERSGQIIALRPRGAALLADLLVRRNRCVARRELASRLWPGCAATESSFSTLVAEVRRAVGDNGRRQGVIRTIGSRGYQFVARVEEARPVHVIDGARDLRGAGKRPPASTVGALDCFAVASASPGDLVDADRVAADSLDLARTAGPRHLDVQSPRPDAFVDEWARTASELGFDVHRTHCNHDSSPPLWPWWQLSASLIESLEAPDPTASRPTREHFDRTRAIWRRVQLELEDSARRTGSRDEPSKAGERQRRFALCHGLARALLRTASHAPCALVLEQIGPADDDTARLLRFVLMHVSPPTPLWILSSRVVPANLSHEADPLVFPRSERVFLTSARAKTVEADFGRPTSR